MKHQLAKYDYRHRPRRAARRRPHYAVQPRLGASKLTVPFVVAVTGLFLLLFAFLFLAGTGDKPATAPGSAPPVISTGDAAAPRTPSKKRVLKVGLNSWVVLAKHKGWLNETFDPLGVEVEIVDRRVAGSAEAALFQRGDIHIAERMAYPSLQHKANGFDFVVVWASGECHPRRATTVVRKNSPAKKLADLKGRTLGAHRLGCPYFATYEALLAEGLQLDTELKKGDVRHVNITGQPAFLALLSGEIEALATHPAIPEVAVLLERGLIREIGVAKPGGQYVTNGGRALIISTRRFANQNPDLIQAYLRLYDRTRRYIVDGNHYDETAELAAEAYRSPKSVSLYIIKDDSTLALNPGRPSARETIEALSSFLKWAVANGDDFYTSKPLTAAQVEEFVDTRFFEGGAYYVDTTGAPAPAPVSASAPAPEPKPSPANTASR
jgi:sulfonate transport system substrate-binding protein